MKRLTGASPAPGSAVGERSDVFWLVPALVILSLLPIRFDLAGQLLNPSRALLLVMTPYLMAQWLSGRYGRLVYTDYAIAFFCVWMTLAVANFNPSRVFGFAGSNVLQVIGGYLIGRAAVRSAEDFFALTRVMVIAILALLPLAFYESVLNQDSPILNWLEQYPAISAYRDSDMCCRLGLNRAQAVLIQPIHYGIFCSLAIAPFVLGMHNRVPATTRYVVTGLLLLAVLFSVSSGALMTSVLQLGMVGYAVMFHGFKDQWKLMNRALLVGYVLLELITTKFAFFTLAEKVAFSSHNAYTRQVMVDTGIKLVGQYPLFGYGLRSWPLPYWMRYSTSIDNYWLVLAGSFGLPTFLAAFTAFLVPLFFVGGKRLTKGSDLYYIRLSWTFLMAALLLSFATVHLWDVLTSIVYMMLGAGIFLMYATEPSTKTAQQEAGDDAARAPKRPVHTRFPPRPPVSARRQPLHGIKP